MAKRLKKLEHFLSVNWEYSSASQLVEEIECYIAASKFDKCLELDLTMIYERTHADKSCFSSHDSLEKLISLGLAVEIHGKNNPFHVAITRKGCIVVKAFRKVT